MPGNAEVMPSRAKNSSIGRKSLCGQALDGPRALDQLVDIWVHSYKPAEKLSNAVTIPTGWTS
jgi:hypothetical protein